MNELIERALDGADRLGARYADVRVVERRNEGLTVKNGALEAATSNVSAGFGVRVLVNGAWGFSSSAVLTPDEADRIAGEAVEIARASAVAQKEPIELDDTQPVTATYRTPHDEDPFAVSLDDKLRILMDADAAMGRVPGVAIREGSVMSGRETKTFASTSGARIEQEIVEAGTLADVPVMVDFGSNKPERPLSELVTKKLRPGDIYTHVYSGLRGEQDPSGHVNPALLEGRKRGVIFDVGHGGGSFLWRIAVPAIKEGFLPDSISTDLHIGSMNAGMKSMLNVMDKFLAMGLSLDDVIARSTWNPAREIKQDGLGHLSVGAVADVAVLRVERGQYGLVDMYGARMDGAERLMCELTVRDGKVVYDLNGISRPDWRTLPSTYGPVGDPRWDGLNPPPIRR